jgi:hypothetical protein
MLDSIYVRSVRVHFLALERGLRIQSSIIEVVPVEEVDAMTQCWKEGEQREQRGKRDQREQY